MGTVLVRVKLVYTYKYTTVLIHSASIEAEKNTVNSSLPLTFMQKIVHALKELKVCDLYKGNSWFMVVPSYLRWSITGERHHALIWVGLKEVVHARYVWSQAPQHTQYLTKSVLLTKPASGSLNHICITWHILRFTWHSSQAFDTLLMKDSDVDDSLWNWVMILNGLKLI